MVKLKKNESNAAKFFPTIVNYFVNKYNIVETIVMIFICKERADNYPPNAINKFYI